NDTSPTYIYTLSLHDALPIYCDELVFQAVRFLRFPVEARIIQCKSSAMSDRREEVNVFRIESSGLCRSRREHSRNRVLDKNWQRSESTRLNSSHVATSYAVFS